MLSRSKPYKKTSKVNMKKKGPKEDDSGMIVAKNSSRKRFPVISLPEIVTSHILQEYRRFVNNAASVAQNFTIFHLLSQFSVATTAVLALTYVKALRIKKIRILAPVTTQGTSVTLKLVPVGTDSGNNNFNSVSEVYLDTSASIDVPAYISLTPSLDTPLGSWHKNLNVTGNLFYLEAPKGSTLDILFEYLLNVDEGVSAYSRAVVGATAGKFYAADMSNFVPQGINSI